MGYFNAEAESDQQSLASALQYGGDTFADVNNLDHCIKYLNQTLATYGFPLTINLYSNDPASVVQTCNCIYSLLQQRQRDIDFREVANDQRQRALSDMTRLEAKVERQDGQLTAKERELAALTSKEQKAAVAFKAQIEKLQHERDEYQRLVISTQQVRVQQSHELKKKEKEYVKLQEKLNQVLTEKKKETKPGLEIMNLLQKEGRQRGTWNSKKADGDFYKMIVDAYEAKKQELMAENMDLRALLRSTQSDLRDLMNSPNGLAKANSINGSFDLEQPSTPRAGHTDVFDLPFHMARDQIEQSLRAKMASIKERMIQLQEAQRVSKVNTEASDRELELEAQLVEARSIITEQASLMGKQVTEDLRSCPLIQVAVETDKGASLECANQDEIQWSAMNKMVAELGREQVDVDYATRGLETQFSPENQIAKPEIANTGSESETPKRQPESRESSEEVQACLPETQVASFTVLKSGPELDVLSVKESRSVHSQTCWLENVTASEEMQKSFFERAGPLFENQTKRLDNQHLHVNFSVTQSPGPLHQSVWMETSPISWCKSPSSLLETSQARSGYDVPSTSILHEVSNVETQVPRFDTRIYSQAHPALRKSLPDSKRFDRRNVPPDRLHVFMGREQSGSRRACLETEHKISGGQSFSLSQEIEHDNQKACHDEATNWPELSTSWSNRRRSSQDFQRGRPEFQFIVDEAGSEDSHRSQDHASQMETLVPCSEMRPIQLKSWVETQKQEGRGHLLSPDFQARHASTHEPKTKQQVSCCCFHVPSVFLITKK